MQSILIVDDNKDILLTLRKALLRFGFDRIFLSDNPRKALSFLKNKKVDVIITDFDMPEINGLELITKAYRISKKFKYIIISVLGKVSLNNKNFRSKILAEFEKPVDLITLTEVITNSNKKILKAS